MTAFLKKYRLGLFVFLIIIALYVGYESHKKALSTNSNQPDSYSGQAIHITVTDRLTGFPLEQTFIIARWIIMEPDGLKGASWSKVLTFFQAISDSSGRATIPQWGPIYRPHGWEMMRGSDPTYMVFHPGYVPQFLSSPGFGSNPQYPIAPSARPEKEIEISVQLQSYEKELAENPPTTNDVLTKNWKPSSSIEMMELVARDLEINILDSSDEESAISSEWQTIVAVDNELQNLSNISTFQWSNKKNRKDACSNKRKLQLG